jgi:transcriptional regulator with XRE-family HTH domain
MAKQKRGQSTAAAIDAHVGRRIRECRIILGLTQRQLAEMIGISNRQAHKYEQGVNSVSAGRLFEIARVLSTPLTSFYEGIEEEGPRQIMPHQRKLIEITCNIAEIRNEKQQAAISQLVRALAST